MVKATGSNTKMLRNNNRIAILWKLFNNGSMSRVALAKECQLTGASITILVKQLLEEGIVIESGIKLQRNSSGRKEVLIDINYDSFLAVNVNIESEKLHISLCGLKNIYAEQIISTDEMLKSSDKVKFLSDKITEIIGDKKDKVLGVGIGVIGVVDDKSGVLVNSYGLFEKNYKLKDELEKLLKMKVFVSNNVRAHAKSIISDKETDFLYIKHGPGLGCALIIKGNIVKGANNQAGELGHTIVDYNGEQCKCGKKGCLEIYISEKRLLEKYKKSVYFTGTISEMYNLYRNNEIATEILDDCIFKLAYSIVNANTLINPKMIIVSGGIFDNPRTFNALREKLEVISSDNPINIYQLDKNIKIKAMANARLVFDNLIFK
jgi:predicted NBD/HSP70 family sugar kinase